MLRTIETGRIFISTRNEMRKYSKKCHGQNVYWHDIAKGLEVRIYAQFFFLFVFVLFFFVLFCFFNEVLPVFYQASLTLNIQKGNSLLKSSL